MTKYNSAKYCNYELRNTLLNLKLFVINDQLYKERLGTEIFNYHYTFILLYYFNSV